MLSRRFFVACGLCAASGFAATEANAQTAAPGVKRTVLSTTDGPATGYETMIALLEFAPNAVVLRHTHFGMESAYLLEGGFTVQVQGQADRVMKPGETYQVPALLPHGGVAGAQPVKILANFTLEKGKPFLTRV